MALNWAMLNVNRSPVPLPNEQTITTIDSDVELSLTIPDAPPSDSASSGGSGGVRRLKEKGSIWITDQRLIYTSTADNCALKTLSVPLHGILSTKFEQPTFGENYFSFDIKPVLDGGLTPGTKAEIRLKGRPMFEFVSVLEKTRERALYMKRQAAEEEEEAPPSYTSPGPSLSVTPAPRVPPPAENPPGYDA